MANSSYVRKELISQSAPPIASTGALGWLRANLFGTPMNSVLTVLSLAFIFLVLYEVLPWMLRSSWTANSLRECREAIDLRWGDHVDGACWAVIKERYLQFLFGFYPSELYMRPILAFVMLLVAMAPILFPAIPRWTLWYSAAFPFACFWLLWGGPIWVPVAAAYGFALGYFAFVGVRAVAGQLAGVVAALFLPAIWWIVVAMGPVAGQLDSLVGIGIQPVESANFGGFMLSVTIGITGIALSLPIGILLALGRQSDLLILKTLCVGFIEFIRGVPLITLLFVASVLLNIFLPPGTNFDIILRVIIMVTLFSSAYMAEIIRGGLAALPRGQYEAADSLGLDYWRAQRLIIMPQALKISIPAIVGNFIGLFKDTTLVSIIGLLDPIGLTTNIRADVDWNGIVWELYGFVALVFFVFCFAMSRYSMYLERKLNTEHR